METAIVVAIITSVATILAAIITLLPKLKKRRSDHTIAIKIVRKNGKVRTVYYQGVQHQFLKFGPLTSRIQPMDGGESFTVSTSMLFHDATGTEQVSNSNRP